MIGIEHDQLTMNRQSTAGHSIAAYAEGGRRGANKQKTVSKNAPSRKIMWCMQVLGHPEIFISELVFPKIKIETPA